MTRAEPTDQPTDNRPQATGGNVRRNDRAHPGLAVALLTMAVVVGSAALAVTHFDRADIDRTDIDRAGLDTVDHDTGSDPARVYDPYRAGEELPVGYLQVLPRDAIEPMYAPRFTTADGIGWPDDADVIGVTVAGEARAYPVSFLNGREMVIDEIAGEPLLVSW